MKVFVLSSGGLDSTTCIAEAVDGYGQDNVETISIYYGQKHKKELLSAEKVSEYYGIPHHVLDLSMIFNELDNPLMEGSDKEIEMTSYDEQVREDPSGKVKTYIPFRNGLFISAITSYAMSLYPDEEIQIWIGVHSDDSAGNAYADTSMTFISHMANAIESGTYGKIHLYAPFVNLTKADVVQHGLSLKTPKTPYSLTWSCYNGGERACGKCATCRDRLEAFRLNNQKDPILYEED